MWNKLTPTETSWDEMQRRCNDPRRVKYKNYGARGIKVDPHWDKFDNFLADMGERPEGKTLGRLDNDGDYNKNNCAWQTSTEQADNKGAYKNNASGLKGVSFDWFHQKWAAHTKGGTGRKKRLYFGADFFEAVCARKSWEVTNG